ncbi:MAG: hypothetical protein MSS89_06585 [Prevotella sp.]|nr:hypothetical protein [Prevotella sp.]MCI7424871.1 hypothetical protein [Prevotella sp.]
MGTQAQVVDDDFDNFIKTEVQSFDKFIDDANKQFISFLRNPWKEFEAKKPVEKRTKPEPVKPVVYDEKKDPVAPPLELDIEDILGQSTGENKQRPQGKINDGEKVGFEKPQPKPATPATKPATPTDKPTTPTAKPATPTAKPATPATKPTTPATKPATPTTKPTTPALKPATPALKPTTPATKPTTPTLKPATPTVKPATPTAKPASPTAKPTTPAAKPATPTSPTTPPTVVPVPTAKPSAPMSALYKESSEKQMINYCGQRIYVDKSLKGVCSIGNMREKAVADAYEAMCKADYKPLLADCRQLKKDLKLNDWGVFLFVRDVSNALCADAHASVVMQQFLLNELGYKSKMARRADRDQMLLFVATDCKMYGRPYFTKDGLNYYNLTSDETCQFYMCQEDSPKAKSSIDMQITNAPLLNSGMVNSVHKNGAGTVAVSVDVPKSLMLFYKSMPQCDYSVYVNAKVNPAVADRLLSSLAPIVEGKSETEAANLLINFVQTGFKYATDQEQFGYEKPFFVEELFYYPYCDCEDRSVLYSYLVRNLLKLDVVLLDYPNHIATAVCFNENVSGDFVTVEGKKYIVCDPTYIGASIGKAMPQFKRVAAKVLKY